MILIQMSSLQSLIYLITFKLTKQHNFPPFFDNTDDEILKFILKVFI